MDEARRLAELLAANAGAQLLRKTEIEVADGVDRLGDQALQTALEERRKGGTRAPA